MQNLAHLGPTLLLLVPRAAPIPASPAWDPSAAGIKLAFELGELIGSDLHATAL